MLFSELAGSESKCPKEDLINFMNKFILTEQGDELYRDQF